MFCGKSRDGPKYPEMWNDIRRGGSDACSA
jgi:hypothetical protein